MERLIVLGTGNASVTKCFNTCFLLEDAQGRYLMVDAGVGPSGKSRDKSGRHP